MTHPQEHSTELIGGKYVLEKLIGEGATGEVWRARHTTLKSAVAIKFLHGASAFKDSRRKRFLQEARVAARLNTRHAVKVFDFGFNQAGRPFLIMELLDGEPLSARLRREGKLSLEETSRILRFAARALDKAHALGVVHRDFKPDNIYLVHSDEDEDVKVVDFGVAKLIGQLGEDDDDDQDLSGSGSFSASSITDWRNMSLTKTGRAVGTPCYMAPEQTRTDDEIGPAVDIWALGVVAYECLVGRRPFDGKDVIGLFSRIVTMNYDKAHELDPSIPEAFDDWFRKACALDVTDRFQTASEAVKALVIALGLQGTIASMEESQALNLWDTNSNVSQTRYSSSSPPTRSDHPLSGATSSVSGAVRTSRLAPKLETKASQWLLFAASALVVIVIAIVAWTVKRPPSSSAEHASAAASRAATSAPVRPSSTAAAVRATSAGKEIPGAVTTQDASTDAAPDVASAPTVRKPPHEKARHVSVTKPNRNVPKAYTNPADSQKSAPATTTTTAPTAKPVKPAKPAVSKPSAFDLPDLGL